MIPVPPVLSAPAAAGSSKRKAVESPGKPAPKAPRDGAEHQCMGKVLGASCNAAGFSISGTIWEKFLCKECRSPCGFEVKLKYVRCVPAEIRPPEKVVEGGNKGGSENGWRKGAAPGSPLVCLCNEPKVVKETKKEDGKSVPTGRITPVYDDPHGALVMLHPDSVGSAPADWTEPSQRTHPEWDIKDGMVRLFYCTATGKGTSKKW